MAQNSDLVKTVQQCPKQLKKHHNSVFVIDVKNVGVLGTCNGSRDLYKKVHVFSLNLRQFQ
jgi:hypothetical protein